MNTPAFSPRGLAAFALGLGLAGATLSAQTLFLDFGPTVTTSTANSPYHSVLPSAGTSWNRVQNADVASGLLFADGGSASGVTVDVGAGTYTSIDFGVNPSGNNALGTVVNHGVYAGTSVGKDGIFHGSGTTQSGVAVQVSGLAAGTYDIYVVAINTNSGALFDLRQRVGATASAPVAGTFTPGDTINLTNAGASIGSGDGTGATDYSSAWSEGLNYVKLSVSITAGQSLIVYSLGIPTVAGGLTEETRGFLNSVQIVQTAIPEPSAAAALGGACALGLAAMRRRRRA